MWYGGGITATPAASGWSRAGTRKQSVAESDAPPPGGGKPASGRVIRIINNMDHSIQVWYLHCIYLGMKLELELEDLSINDRITQVVISGNVIYIVEETPNWNTDFANRPTDFLMTK